MRGMGRCTDDGSDPDFERLEVTAIEFYRVMLRLCRAFRALIALRGCRMSAAAHPRIHTINAIDWIYQRVQAHSNCYIERQT